MREGLAREIPEAVRAFAWTRAQLPARMGLFSHEPVLWATVSAIGAGFLAAGLTQFLLGLVFDVLEAFRVNATVMPVWIPLIVGTSAAVAVALRAGGARSLTLYLIYLALDLAVRIPGVMTFCERSGGQSLTAPSLCTPAAFLAAQWPLWTGIGVGLLLSRTITAEGEGTNRTLRVAGAYAVAMSIMVQVWAATIAQGGDAMNSSLALSALTVAAAVVAGVVAGLSEHRLRAASIVALFLLLPWLTVQLPYLLREVGRLSPEFVPPFLVAVLGTPIAAIALIVAAVVSDRHRFIPREPA
jgi:hypothetical protein